MLINVPKELFQDSISLVLAVIEGNSTAVKEIDTGVYQIGHFNGPDDNGYEPYPDLGNIGPYGVCDNYQQILNHCPLINNSDRKFFIALTPVVKANQPDQGGWRWHKWGQYIGEHEPQYEYLYDEEDIDIVYVYHIYEKLSD